MNDMGYYDGGKGTGYYDGDKGSDECHEFLDAALAEGGKGTDDGGKGSDTGKGGDEGSDTGKGSDGNDDNGGNEGCAVSKATEAPSDMIRWARSWIAARHVRFVCLKTLTSRCPFLIPRRSGTSTEVAEASLRHRHRVHEADVEADAAVDARVVDDVQHGRAVRLRVPFGDDLLDLRVVAHVAQPERHRIPDGVVPPHRASPARAVERVHAVDVHLAPALRARQHQRAAGPRGPVLARKMLPRLEVIWQQ